ncbi:MAG TPA: GntR family transcriptional regulator [Candidatus Limnocylindria bacterium]|nr:GntR family transcriptional regulator [Candidatus Limnocylindria bacterium]
MTRTTLRGGGAFQKPTTLAVETARHLREAIIRGEFASGAHLNETQLTRELSLSRSPVREALRILEAEGLVTLEPHRGAYVRGVSEQDLDDIFDMRLMIETHGVRRGLHRLSPEAIVPLRAAVAEARAALREADLDRWHRASLHFHDGLVVLAANRHLTRLHEELKTSLRRYQISVIGPAGEPERFQAEHETILAALEDGRVEGGAALVAEHITNLKEALLKAIAGTA